MSKYYVPKPFSRETVEMLQHRNNRTYYVEFVSNTRVYNLLAGVLRGTDWFVDSCVEYEAVLDAQGTMLISYGLLGEDVWSGVLYLIDEGFQFTPNDGESLYVEYL